MEPDSRRSDEDPCQGILQGELGMEHAVVRECSGRVLLWVVHHQTSIRKPDWGLGNLRRL